MKGYYLILNLDFNLSRFSNCKSQSLFFQNKACLVERNNYNYTCVPQLKQSWGQCSWSFELSNLGVCFSSNIHTLIDFNSFQSIGILDFPRFPKYIYYTKVDNILCRSRILFLELPSLKSIVPSLNDG